MAKKASVSDIVAAYKQLVADQSKTPTREQLLEKAAITEKQFEEFFGNVEEVGRKAWSDYLTEIQKQTESSETYQSYGARERMIAYFFSLFEILAPDRAFVDVTHCDEKLTSEYRSAFKAHMKTLVQDGIEGGELLDRFSLAAYYPDILWGLHQQLVHFWLHDSSDDYTATERAIEIYSKVPLELMGHNLFDSLVESVRFSFENFNLDRFFR